MTQLRHKPPWHEETHRVERRGIYPTGVEGTRRSPRDVGAPPRGRAGLSAVPMGVASGVPSVAVDEIMRITSSTSRIARRRHT